MWEWVNIWMQPKIHQQAVFAMPECSHNSLTCDEISAEGSNRLMSCLYCLTIWGWIYYQSQILLLKSQTMCPLQMLSNLIFFEFNPLTHGKFLGWSKILSIRNNEMMMAEKLKFVSGRVENIMEKEKMLVTSILSFSHNVFKGLFPQRHQKSIFCGTESKP